MLFWVVRLGVGGLSEQTPSSSPPPLAPVNKNRTGIAESTAITKIIAPLERSSVLPSIPWVGEKIKKLV